MPEQTLTPWSKGAPPSVGWWNASVHRNPQVRRWWNGAQWSRPVYPGDSASRAHERQFMAASAFLMEWRGLADEPQA